MKHIATRDIKFGSVDGDRWVKAGDEISDADLPNFPPSTFRTIDENTFPGGKCPTCGSVIATTEGQAGRAPIALKDPPSVQGGEGRAAVPTGDDAVKAARESMRTRPDNADSGLPSFGKIPVDVEASLVQGRPTAAVRRDVTAPATGGQFVPTPGQRQPSPEQRRDSANAAPKVDPNATNMGGFGGDPGGQASGTGVTAQPAAPADVASTGGPATAADAQQQPQGQPAPRANSGRGSGSANKP